MLVLKCHGRTIRLLRLRMAVNDDLHRWASIEIHVGSCGVEKEGANQTEEDLLAAESLQRI
jgi:hypothetical protein